MCFTAKERKRFDDLCAANGSRSLSPAELTELGLLASRLATFDWSSRPRRNLLLVEKTSNVPGDKTWRVMLLDHWRDREYQAYRGTPENCSIIADSYAKIGYTDVSHFRCADCNTLLGFERGPVCSNCDCDRQAQDAHDDAQAEKAAAEHDANPGPHVPQTDEF